MENKRTKDLGIWDMVYDIFEEIEEVTEDGNKMTENENWSHRSNHFWAIYGP